MRRGVVQERVRKTILLVSHDLNEALKLGDRVTLEGGHIVQSGNGRAIVEQPAEDYVAEFVRHVNPRTAIKGGHGPSACRRPPRACQDGGRGRVRGNITTVGSGK
jgi:ABC-type proline/glycine betaine transport system ATPase subunit